MLIKLNLIVTNLALRVTRHAFSFSFAGTSASSAPLVRWTIAQLESCSPRQLSSRGSVAYVYVSLDQETWLRGSSARSLLPKFPKGPSRRLMNPSGDFLRLAPSCTLRH